MLDILFDTRYFIWYSDRASLKLAIPLCLNDGTLLIPLGWFLKYRKMYLNPISPRLAIADDITPCIILVQYCCWLIKTRLT